MRSTARKQAKHIPTRSPSRTSRSACCSRAANRHASSSPMPVRRYAITTSATPTDPRVAHTLTLEVDDFGNVLKSRRRRLRPAPAGPQSCQRRPRQASPDMVTYTENAFTNAIDADDVYRTPLSCEARAYELTGFTPENNAPRFSFEELTRNDFALLASSTRRSHMKQTADSVAGQKRLIEHVAHAVPARTISG